MAGTRRAAEETLAGEAMRPPEQRPSLAQITPVRQQVRETVGQATRSRQIMQLYQNAFEQLSAPLERDHDVSRQLRESQLGRFTKIENLFDSAQIQYAYNQRQKIYSMSVMLDNRPRIITLRVGDDFTELSLADRDGNVLEVLREEDGRGVTFNAAN
jgi:predicted transcriptional regulator